MRQGFSHQSCLVCIDGRGSEQHTAQFVRPLGYFDSMVDRNPVMYVHSPTWPADGDFGESGSIPDAEENFFRMLREKAGSHLYILGLCAASGFECERSSNRVAVALRPPELKHHCIPDLRHGIAQQSQLRGV